MPTPEEKPVTAVDKEFFWEINKRGHDLNWLREIAVMEIGIRSREAVTWGQSNLNGVQDGGFRRVTRTDQTVEARAGCPFK